MIFFNRSKIIVDAFTCTSHVYDYAPIAAASKFMPKWWQDLPQTVPRMTPSGITVEQSTMKTCRGFIDLYRHGLIIPLWSEFVIQTAADGSWRSQWSDIGAPANSVITHSKDQYGDMVTGETHIKFVTPWLLKEKTGVDFVFNPVTWQNPSSVFKVLPGVVNFKYQHSVNINMLIKSIDQTASLDHGTPLVHLIPLSEKKVEIRNHLVTAEEYDRLMGYSGTMISFRNVYKTKKNINEAEGAQCPFHKIAKSKSIWTKSDSTSSSGLQ